MPTVRPSFVVDITAQFEKKLKAILLHFSSPAVLPAQRIAGEPLPSRADINARMGSEAQSFGHMIGVRYGEPFIMRETAAIDDIVRIPGEVDLTSAYTQMLASAV